MIDQTAEACAVAGKKYAVPASIVMAVVETESNGQTFATVHNKPEPLIRWEGHYFDARLSGIERLRARNAGLASPKAGGIKNPSKQEDRWVKLLEPAIQINEEAAYESVSIGVGQVMGAHDSKLGFASAKAMFQYAQLGAEQQVDLMMRYCVKFGLIDKMQRADFAGFARGYNGANFKQYGYDTTMAEHAKRFAQFDKATAMPATARVIDDVTVAKPERAAAAETMLRIGTSGLKVREAQELLNRAAPKYGLTKLEVDADFGPATETAVKAFQKAVGFIGKDIDGIIGPLTQSKLDTFRSDPSEQPGAITPTQVVTETPEGRQGAITAVAGTAATGLIGIVKDAMPADMSSFAFVASLGALAVIVGGVLWVYKGWQRSQQTIGVEV